MLYPTPYSCTPQYSILVIIVDGMPTDTYPTEEAVNRSADVPLFIIIVGVGDGPWDNMNRFIATFKFVHARVCVCTLCMRYV